MDTLNPGDLLVVKGRWGIKSVAIMAGYKETTLLAYECTTDERPPCMRTGRENPLGVQAHQITGIATNGGLPTFHLSLRCPLFPLEEDRLLSMVELQLGYDSTNANLVADALVAVNRLQSRPRAWTPNRLVRHLIRIGVCEWGRQLN